MSNRLPKLEAKIIEIQIPGALHSQIELYAKRLLGTKTPSDSPQDLDWESRLDAVCKKITENNLKFDVLESRVLLTLLFNLAWASSKQGS